MSEIIYTQGTAIVSLAANQGIAVYTRGQAQVYSVVGYPNYPESESLLGVVINGQTVFAASSSARTIRIDAGSAEVLYNVGATPLVAELSGYSVIGSATALNATGTITSAMIVGGIITSTTAAGAVTATLPTGAVLDAALNLPIGASFVWSAVNTGGANAFTVASAASGNALTGAGAVAHSTSGSFRTIKTAASTYATYRIG
jgi:hypothetical protein